jgi:SAM-dependent methyltransferase
MFKNESADRDKKAQWNKDWAEVKDIYFWRLRQHYFAVAKRLQGSVCDLGCGPGYLAAFTEPNEGFYTGVDISEVGIEYAKFLFPGAHFLVADIAKEHINLPDASFDTVVASEVIEHLPDFSNVLKEMVRLSRLQMVISMPVNMPNDDHYWPIWSEEDIRREFAGMGTITEIFRDEVYNFNVVTIKK